MEFDRNSVTKDYIGKGFNVGVQYTAKIDRLGFGGILREQELMNILPGVVADELLRSPQHWYIATRFQ